MTAVLAGRSPATFEIKSANLPLVALLLKTTNLRTLAADLSARFGDIPDFFDNDPLVLDLSPLQPACDGVIDFFALRELLRGYRVMPVAVRGGNAAQMADALAAGLAPAADAKTWMPEPGPPPPPPPPDGNIHVYAPLRGKAIAGARGNTEARIISLCLEAELLSIAGVYRTSEVPLPADVLSRPAQVRLDGGADGKLVMAPIS